MNPKQDRDGNRPDLPGDRPLGPERSGRRSRADDPLARLLRAHADRTAPRQGKLDELADRIARAIENEKFLDLEPSPTVLLAPRWRRAWSAAVAAALLVGIGVGTWFGSLPMPPGGRAPAIVQAPRSASPAESPVSIPGKADPGFAMDRERLRQIARRLFDETERLFPGQLLWIAEAAAAEPETDRGRGGHVELGIARDGRADTGMAQAGGPLEPLVTIHLVARARNADHLPWRDEWEVTVISRPEEMVRFRPGGGGLPAGEWALWSMPLADGGIAVETRIEEPGSGSEPATNVPLVDITTVQQPGAPLLVATTRRGAQTIEVFQWVDVVAEKREGESPQSDGEASKEGA